MYPKYIIYIIMSIYEQGAEAEGGFCEYKLELYQNRMWLVCNL